jgi:hypothetical protein
VKSFLSKINIVLITIVIYICYVEISLADRRIYFEKYTLRDSYVDYGLIKNDIKVILYGSLVGVGVLYTLPESITNWNKNNIKLETLTDKWYKNIKAGPVWDNDDFFLNYVTHPYWGAVYYIAGRSAGAGALTSFYYSVIVSTFFWEYGVEAFAEVPSIQDLIITPVVGSIFGETFYLLKRYIINNNNKLFNSKIIGKTLKILMDPITEVSSLFTDDKDINNSYSFLYPSYKNGKTSINFLYVKRF